LWRIREDLFAELGYRDYIGALQRYWVEHPREVELLPMSSFDRLPVRRAPLPESLDVLKRLKSFGPTVIPSDGDVVFQPRKVEHAGLSRAVDGHVLIYIHKEEPFKTSSGARRALRRCGRQAAHPVGGQANLGERVTTVFPHQGTYADDPEVVRAFPPVDVTIEHIGDLLDYDLPRLLRASRVPA